ncbi:MAG: hypothetical protein ACI9S8_000094 [Chlamydiales bacterium]|jgi:hypothetical protein
MFLKNNFSKARPGDYIVTMFNKSFTVLHIFSKEDDSLIIEEVTVPVHKFPKGRPSSWNHWYKEGAEHHTSWVMYDVDLSSAKIREYYSFSRKGWLELNDTDSIFSTLLSLPFELVEKKNRRKQGPPPAPGDLDRRSIWNPRMIVNGGKIDNVLFNAWKTRWPKDGSDLAGKLIQIYLPEESNIYPSYYPYWLQVQDTLGIAKVRVVDSGNNLKSPMKALPRRPPEILNHGEYTDEGLRITFKSPAYYKEFILLALPDKNLYKHPIPLKCETIREKRNSSAAVFTSFEELESKLAKHEYYRFLIIPKEYDEVWVETSKSLIWPPPTR